MRARLMGLACSAALLVEVLRINRCFYCTVSLATAIRLPSVSCAVLREFRLVESVFFNFVVLLPSLAVPA